MPAWQSLGLFAFSPSPFAFLYGVPNATAFNDGPAGTVTFLHSTKSCVR